MTNKEIGERIRSLRKSEGLTLDQVAELTGQRKQHLSALELGKLSVSDSQINEVLKVFGYEISRSIKKISDQ